MRTFSGTAVGFGAGVAYGLRNARILMLAVPGSHPRRGVGATLMEAFLKECATGGLATVELEARISNKDAITSYQRYEFQIAQVLKSFYTDGEDGYKMIRHL